MTAPCVMIMAGGTGGHVFPALSLADWLRARGVRIVWLGTRGGIEARLVPAASIDVEWIAIGGLRGKGLVTLLAAPLRLLRALYQSLRAIRRHRPVAVVGLGGYVTGPGGLAARLSATPLVIHEQNAVAGLTNRLLARVADVVLEAFAGGFAAPIRATAIGNPVRSSFFSLPPSAERYAMRTGPIRLLVVGGSQGAAKLNALMPAAVARMQSATPLLIKHQAGAQLCSATEEAYASIGADAEVTSFIDDMAGAYAWADLVVCRAGALTVSEIAAAGVAAVFVPLPSAVDDHQTRNAEFLVAQGAAVCLPQHDLDATKLASELQRLCGERGSLAEMALRASRLARPDATRLLGEHTLRAAGIAPEGAA